MSNNEKAQNRVKKQFDPKVLPIAMLATGIGIQIGTAWMDELGVRVALSAAAVVVELMAAEVWYILRKSRTSPKEAMVDVLREAGFECGINEDEDICIKVGEAPLFAHVVELPVKGHQRVHFSAMIAVDDEKISEQGLQYLVSQMNSHNEFITMLLREDGLECRVETVVSKAKDVLREMDFAVNQIGRALHVVDRNMKSLAEKYPARGSSNGKNRIGFVLPTSQHDHPLPCAS